jgi:hypothetical protein
LIIPLNVTKRCRSAKGPCSGSCPSKTFAAALNSNVIPAKTPFVLPVRTTVGCVSLDSDDIGQADARLSRCAHNVSGAQQVGNSVPDTMRSIEIEIDNNVIQRVFSPYLKGGYTEDHGIYAWGMRNLSIANNLISGWSDTVYGGSLKLRNGEEIDVANNRLYESGKLLYAYSASVPQYLKRVVIRNNRLTINQVHGCYGLVYWRNFASTTLVEEDILVDGNDFGNGCVVINNPANGPSFTIQNNYAASYALFPTGVVSINNN